MTTATVSPRSDTLTRALAELAEIQFHLGDWRAAHASMTESLRAARSSGVDDGVVRALAGLAVIEAGRGQADACRTHASHAIGLSRCLGGSPAEVTAGQAVGLLELGLGRLTAAIERLESVAHVCEGHPRAWAAAVRCTLDLMEALLLRGDKARARGALARAESRQQPSGGWALVSATARSRAMLATDSAFEPLFQRALAWNTGTQQPFERARTELCFGERLLGARRRREARVHLGAALGAFTALDAQPWADRTRRELVAT